MAKNIEKETNVVEIEETEKTEEVKESKFKTFIAKSKETMQKCAPAAKEILKVAGAVCLAIAAYEFGKKSNDRDVIDAEFTELDYDEPEKLEMSVEEEVPVE